MRPSMHFPEVAGGHPSATSKGPYVVTGLTRQSRKSIEGGLAIWAAPAHFKHGRKRHVEAKQRRPADDAALAKRAD
ncbi:hypothetical protein NMY22_g5494 [Coprinellus aureogranulatus]|nr:hypothetical protein NMY22_g5494 [Coprinellus aureogranulatus]